MKIKRKLEMNLPQLIEWGFNNPKEVESKIFESDNIDYFFNTAHVQFSNDGCGVRMSSSVSVDDTFTVEVEEEVTEDTVIPKVLNVFKNTTNRIRNDEESHIRRNVSVKEIKENSKDYIENDRLYIMNDDLTITLIWTREKGLVE